MARNLADSLIIPFQVEDYAKTLKDGVDNLENEFGLLMKKNGIELGNFIVDLKFVQNKDAVALLDNCSNESSWLSYRLRKSTF